MQDDSEQDRRKPTSQRCAETGLEVRPVAREQGKLGNRACFLC